MLLRIWILLLTVLLLAAPVGTVAESAIDADLAGLCADEVESPRELDAASPVAAPRLDPTAARDLSVPPQPALARIFRPPRAALA